MSNDTKSGSNDNPNPTDAENLTKEKRPLPEAAKRALQEAEERRRIQDEQKQKLPREIGGRGGEDPSRFGDWEIDGRAIDF